MTPIKIFVCYSHVDKVWVEPEQPHGLMPWLQRQLKSQQVEIWWDTGIHGGDDFKKLIFEKIDESQIAILLFSNNVAGSEFILNIELPRIRDRYEEKKLTILPILLSPLSDLTREMLDWVLDIQMVPSSGKGLNASVGTREWPEIQTNVLNELYRRVKLLRAHEASAYAPPPAMSGPEPEPVEEWNPEPDFTTAYEGYVPAPVPDDQPSEPAPPEPVEEWNPTPELTDTFAEYVQALEPPPLATYPAAHSSPATVTGSGRRTKSKKKSGIGISLLIYSIPVLALLFVAYLIIKPARTTASTADPKPTLPTDGATKWPWENSLGMKFVPVEGTTALFSIWDVRVQDFKEFVDATGYDATGGMVSLKKGQYRQFGDSWKSPGFSQTSRHPVVGVSWDDAKAFCAWLTDRERKLGKITSSQSYRLPTDEEWSIAVGLKNEVGTTPKEKDGKIKDVYPWGNQWPPPQQSAGKKSFGNYAGGEARDGDWPFNIAVIEDYRDDYPRTSPVGSFDFNRYGLFDMSGNVLQWCDDRYEPDYNGRVLRGASWDYSLPDYLASTYRRNGTPSLRLYNVGFRCVLSGESSR